MIQTSELLHVDAPKAQLRLHRGQTRAWDSNRRFVFVIAGTQSGKTSFGSWWLNREIQERGPGDYLAVTATYDLFKLKMLPELKHVFCELLPGWEWHAGDRVISSVDGGTRIILRSANSPEGLESSTAKAAWLDECGQDSFRLDSWEAVRRRVALHQGRVLGTTTPYNLGWLKTEIFDRWRAGDKSIEVIQFKSIMNPAFPREEYDSAKDTMPAWKFRMFYDGEFTRPAGMIYEDFDDEIHVIDAMPLKPEWPRYLGVDFGAVNNATVWIAEDPERSVFYVYDETLDGGLSTAQHVARAKERAEGVNLVASAGGAKSERQQRMDWTSEGLSLRTPSIVDVEAGIDRVISLLKTKRLFVFRSCRGLLDEFGTYAREISPDGHITEKIKDKETFHRLDALRYCVQLFTDAPVITVPNPFYD